MISEAPKCIDLCIFVNLIVWFTISGLKILYMGCNSTFISRIGRLSLLLFCFCSTVAVHAATFTVTNLNNSGAGSLRQAITNANSSGGADIINFSVSGTINLTFALPGINGPVTIDGTTAPGYVCGAPVVAVDGGGGAGNGFQFIAGSSGSSILGLNVRRFQFNAIQFINSDNNTIQGCFIGTNLAGTMPMSNGQNGVQVEVGSDNLLIGGPNVCDRNVISGNNGTGVALISSINCTVSGNYIGVNATGTGAMGNQQNGIYTFAATGTQIGGLLANEGNVISASAFVGIILDNGSNNSTVFGNKIGTNAAGTAAFGHDDSGLLVINTNNLSIGGNTAAHRNIFSGSVTEFGIYMINGDNCTIQGNYIGTDITGTVGLPNFGAGIVLDAGSVNNTIGGTGAGEANVIAFNTGDGIETINATDNQNRITGNNMFCNTGKGIELNGVGNGSNPAPVIVGASGGGANGTSSPNNTIELFYDASCVPNCQGGAYIGTVVANGAGNWNFSGALINGGRVVATATNGNNTSEFSTCFVILPVEGLTFHATRVEDNHVKLNWETLRENHNGFFAVERSLDGIHFQEIGQVAGANLANGAAYDFSDSDAPNKDLFFRLMQVDLDGTHAYSEVVSVPAWVGEPELLLYDHPTRNNLRFNLSHITEEEITYTLFDLQGRIVKKSTIHFQPGNEVNIPVQDLGRGMYHLWVTAGSKRFVKRISVLGVQ